MTMILAKTKANLFHLLMIRWAMLLSPAILLVFGLGKESPLLFSVVILYCGVLTAFWSKVSNLLSKHTTLLLVDIAITGIILSLSNGGWMSPYILYSLTSLLIISFFTTMRVGLFYAGCLSAIYTIGLMFNGHFVSKTTLINIDLLVLSYVVIYIIMVFLGYPMHIIREIENAKEDMTQVEESLMETKSIIAAISDPNALTYREVEILLSLSKGKTNKQIAEELFISEHTVKNSLTAIYKKLGVANREEAISKFLVSEHAVKSSPSTIYKS
jgi:DNA-binding CsgD family transcriptional regulator